MTTIKGLVFTRASIEHRALVFDWANEVETRKNSMNTSLIRYVDHVKWYDHVTNDPNIHFFIVSKDNDLYFVGQLRIHVDNLKNGEISYAVSKLHREQGIGTRILHNIPELVSREGLDIEEVHGFVKRDNTASMSAFYSAGYRPVPSSDDVVCYMKELKK